MAKRKQSKANAASQYTGMHWKKKRSRDGQGRPQILFFIGMSKSNSVTLAPVRGWFQ